MTDFTSRHIAGYAEGLGLNADHLGQIRNILNQAPGILSDSIETRLIDKGDIPGCSFTANLVDAINIDIDEILRIIRETNQFNSVLGFNVEPSKLALASLQANPQQFSLSA